MSTVCPAECDVRGNFSRETSLEAPVSSTTHFRDGIAIRDGPTTGDSPFSAYVSPTKIARHQDLIFHTDRSIFLFSKHAFVPTNKTDV